MKKKKLFGKFNIIDILILLAIVVVIGLAIWFFHEPEIIATKAATEELSEPTLRFSFISMSMAPELADSVIDALQGEPREIDGITAYPNRLFNNYMLIDAQITDWEKLEREDGTVDLVLTVECTPSFNNNTYVLGVQELRVGINYTLKTYAIELSGKVLSLEKIS